jgi:hypothetical protein
MSLTYLKLKPYKKLKVHGLTKAKKTARVQKINNSLLGTVVMRSSLPTRNYFCCTERLSLFCFQKGEKLALKL